MKSITFYIMTYKGYRVLEEFISHFGHAPVKAVICEKDNGLQNDYYNEIKKLANKHKISFYNRKDTPSVKSDYTFTVSWKWLLKDIPNLIVFHDSLLPRLRGFAPLVTALINENKEIGVTALFAEEEYDRGNIIKQKKIAVNYPIKISEAIENITKCYISLTLDLSKTILSDKKLKSTAQNERDATYSLWRDEDDYLIDWNKDSVYIKRFIDSVCEPYKGAATKWNDQTIRILDSEVIKDVTIENRCPGKIIFINKGLPVIVCGKGLLLLKRATYEDGKNFLPSNKIRVRFC